MFSAVFSSQISLVDNGFDFCSKGGGYYDLFVFQTDTFTESNITSVGIT